jgi:hypothetical protein
MSSTLELLATVVAQMGQDTVELEETAKGKTQVRVSRHGPEAEADAIAAYERIRAHFGTPLEVNEDEMAELLVAAENHMNLLLSLEADTPRVKTARAAVAKLHASLGSAGVAEAQRRAAALLPDIQAVAPAATPPALVPPPDLPPNLQVATEPRPSVSAPPPPLSGDSQHVRDNTDSVVAAVAAGVPVGKALDAAYPHAEQPPGKGRLSNGEMFDLEETPFDDVPASPPAATKRR